MKINVIFTQLFKIKQSVSLYFIIFPMINFLKTWSKQNLFDVEHSFLKYIYDGFDFIKSAESFTVTVIKNK